MISSTNTQQTLTIFYGPSYAKSEIWNDLKSTLIIPTEVSSITTAQRYNPALILLNRHLVLEMEHAKWVEIFPDAIFLCADSMDLDVDLILTNNLPYRQTCKLLEMACYQWVLKNEKTERAKKHDTSFRYLNKLADISISLSSEDDLMTLLHKILDEGQNIACCDAASLYLVNELDKQERDLVFSLVQNDSIDFSFEKLPFPLDESSIAGYVAHSDSELNISDAYQLPADAPYKFNPSFDQKTGYRTKSILAIPLTNKQNEVFGVLQFINRKKARSLKISDERSALAYTLPFDSDINILLRALASQASIAIEQRDPTTSGHSFRAADLCVDLATSVSSSRLARLRNVHFTDPEVRELKYAALLHDFGKVGVSELVLIKEKKLTPGSLENIQYRIWLAQEQLCTIALRKQLEMYRVGNVVESELSLINAEAEADIKLLNEFFTTIIEANEPSVLGEDNKEMLDKISGYNFEALDGDLQIITEDEFSLLSIKKGSLSANERKEIESHVVHTQSFLNRIPWTKEFQNVPTIAGAHHEKLDGSGYPYSMTTNQIPLPLENNDRL